MIEVVRWTQRNMKRWSSGEMALGWTAAGMLEAERQFRKIIGYRDLATLLIAIERDHHRRNTAQSPTKEAAIVRHETERRGHGKGHRDELGDA
jgi:putative transposase